MFSHIWANYAFPSARRQSLRCIFCQWAIKCSLIIRPMQLKSCENRLASVQAGIPHEAISIGAKVNVKQRIYSRVQRKYQQSRAQLQIYTALYTRYIFMYFILTVRPILHV